MSPWPAIELGKVAEIAAGGSAPQGSDDFDNVGIPFVRAGSLKPLTEGAVESSLELLNEEVAKRHRLRLFPAGSVLFAKSGMSATKGLVYRLTSPAYVVNHLAAVISGPDLDSGYLRHCLQVFSPTHFIRDEAYPSIRLSDIASMKIPLPPLEEQKLITDILDRAEALRAKRRAALDQLDELTQSIFIEMFGDPATNTEGWKNVLLGEYTTKIGSGATPTGGESAYKKSGISLIRSLNVRDGEFTYKDLAFIDEQQARKLANVQVEENDVLLNITGASVARVCRVPNAVLPARVNQHVSIIRPKTNINSVFLEQLLLSTSMKRKLLKISGAGATREAITKAQLEELEVILPPLTLQQEFANRIVTVEKLKIMHKTSLAELDELFASLQYRAFRGEL